jgi:hypothetical protein
MARLAPAADLAKSGIGTMPVTLTKVVEGTSPESPANSHVLECPKCEQVFLLEYSDSEWNKVKDWLTIAEVAIRKDHDTRHEAASIPLEWRGVRRR